MNIALFLNKDLYANLAYNLLKEALSAHQLRIYYSEGVGDPSKKPADLIQLEFFEKQFFLGDLPGILNLHSGILPDFKGILGTLHALRTGKEWVGCTLHFIPDNTIDTGEVIDIAKLKVDPGRSLFWHVANLYPLGAAMIAKAVTALASSDKLPCSVQDTAAGSYFSLPTAEDFGTLKSLGFEVVNAADYLELLQRFVSEKIDSRINNGIV